MPLGCRIDVIFYEGFERKWMYKEDKTLYNGSPKLDNWKGQRASEKQLNKSMRKEAGVGKGNWKI